MANTIVQEALEIFSKSSGNVIKTGDHHFFNSRDTNEAAVAFLKEERDLTKHGLNIKTKGKSYQSMLVSVETGEFSSVFFCFLSELFIISIPSSVKDIFRHTFKESDDVFKVLEDNVGSTSIGVDPSVTKEELSF